MDDVAATTTRRSHDGFPPGYRLVPVHELVPQLRFPPGFRFVPTDYELVEFYLRAKIDGRELPLDVVNDVPILDYQPGRLVEEYKGYGENRWFFFTVRKQSSSNKEKEPSRKVRVEGVTATWKATGSVQAIWRKAKDGDGNKKKKKKEKVGSKRVLIYNSSDAQEDGKWSMHEYILQGHDQIGQYALYSIQRKQHSDTDDNAGNGDAEKKTRKRKRTEKPCTEPAEGVQLPHPHPETTTLLLAEPPLKPTRKKAKPQRKKKPSLQVEVDGQQQQQQQQQQQGRSSMEPITPPKKGELVPSSQQELRPQPPPPPPAADVAPAPVVVLSAVPLQAVREWPPSEPNGTLEEYALEDGSEFLAEVSNCSNHPGTLCNCNSQQGLEQWPPSLAAMGGTTTAAAAFLAAPYTTNDIVVGHAHAPLQQPHQQEQDGCYSLIGVQNQHLAFASGLNQSVYMEQHRDPFLTDSGGGGGGWGWENGVGYQLHQIHQHQQQLDNNGWGFGAVEDQQPMNHHPHGGHDLPPVNQQPYGSDDLLFGARGVHQVDELDAFVRGELVPPRRQDEPTTLHLQAAGMQGQWADDTVNLQSLQHDDLQSSLDYWLVQCARNEYVQDGVCAPGP